MLAEFDDETLEQSFFTDPSFKSILFTSSDTPSENIERVKKAYAQEGGNFHIELIQDNTKTVEEVLKRLYEKYSTNVLLVEGGSSVYGSFVESKHLDNLFFTESPYLAIISKDSKTTVTGPKTLNRDELVHLELTSTYFIPETGMTFKHYKVLG